VIYVYGFLSRQTGDAPVEVLDVAGLAVAVARPEGDPPAPTEANILRHAQVVEELTRTGATVLPARFGLVFSDDMALRRTVHKRAGELRAGLDRVRGCVELGLRVLAPEVEREPVAAGGGEYLRARLRETTERERLAQEVDDALAGLARDRTHRSVPSGELLLSAAYLVPETSVDAFRRALRKLEWSHPELDLVCTGPWPPYSFAATTTPSGAAVL
jgi:gas vesicle protein GvpL/GvpF